MEQRTPEERKRIRDTCLKLEKKGGDVIGYLKSEHYISPRATWYNFQREIGRTSFTDGRPKIEGEIIMKTKHDRRETLQGIIEASKEGKDPVAYMTEVGYADPSLAWTNLRQWAKAKAPELYEQLPKARRGRTKKQEEPEPDPEEDKRVEILKVDKVPEIRKEQDPLPVVAVESRVMEQATYKIIDGGMVLTGISVTNGIMMNAFKWVKFSEEIIQAIKQLGVKTAEIGGEKNE